jgi:peptide/nickel transport system permease protein
MSANPNHRFWISLRQNKLALFGFSIIFCLVLISLSAPLIAKYDPGEIHMLNALQPPDAAFLMGTDEFGRDIFSRVIYGTRTSLQTSLLVVLIAGGIGTFLGLCSGYFSGATDFIIMRIMDGLMAFPALLLALSIMAAFGASQTNLILALAIIYIPSFTRLTRNTTLGIRELEFIEASRAAGAGSLRIMIDHVFPNCLSPLIINATVILGYTILSEAALSFLGFGSPSQTSWGTILSDGRDYVFNAPWISIYPGLAISFFVLGTNLAGDGLRDILDPRMK